LADETIASALWEDVNIKIPHYKTRLTKEFTGYIENDVNTPAALELMMETARKRESIADLRYMTRIFGLIY
jgi:hypothetical protein